MQIETYQKRVVEIFRSIEQWVADAIKLEKKKNSNSNQSEGVNP